MTLRKTIDIENIIVFSLVTIVVAGLCSVLYPLSRFIPHHSSQSHFRDEYLFMGSLQGLSNLSWPIFFPSEGQGIHIFASVGDVASVYLKDLENVILWSKANITQIYEFVGPLESGYNVYYVIEIYNPNSYEVNYEIILQLRMK